MSLCFPLNVQRYHGTLSEYPGWNGRCFGVACLILDFRTKVYILMCTTLTSYLCCCAA
jgi:hypothetical protein